MLRPYADLKRPRRRRKLNVHSRPICHDRLLTSFQAGSCWQVGRRAFTWRTSIAWSTFWERRLGHVFLCEHLLLQGWYVKALQRAAASGSMGGLAAAVERFSRARAVAVLDNRISCIFDMERIGAVPFMVMEHVTERVSTRSSCGRSPDPTLPVCQAAKGLQQLTSMDSSTATSPETAARPFGTVKIPDLGLADSSRCRSKRCCYDDNKSVVAQPTHVARTGDEQRDDRYTRDVYSLGLLLFPADRASPV